MTKIHLLVLYQAKLCDELVQITADFRSFDIAGLVDSVADTALILEKSVVDAVAVQLSELSEPFLRFIETLSARPYAPPIALFTPIQDDAIAAKLRKKGCKLIFHIPCDSEDAAEEINRCVALHKKNQVPVNVKLPGDKPLDERLANIFIESGIPPHIKGYQFLRQAVKLAVHTPSMINNITKQLYPSVAKSYNTTSSKVERAIRHAIDVAWSRGKIDNINAIYGIKVFSKGERPTNGELIALISDKLIIEGMS